LLAHTVDDAGTAYLIPLELSRSNVGVENVLDNGRLTLYFDSTNLGTLTRTSVLSSAFPSILTGLDSNVEQAGNTEAFELEPSGAGLNGHNSLAITYANRDVPADREAKLRIFRWQQESQKWRVIGGAVDTVANVITAEITEPGTYAAFTTDAAAGMSPNIQPEGMGMTVSSGSEAVFVTLQVPNSERGEVTVQNALGEIVATLANGVLYRGSNTFTWSTRTMPAGVYFCLARVGSRMQCVKVSVIH
jgi:hypothetical protein